MTISSSLNASVAGLAANATRLATIADNIANSSTYGYRRVETDFHSLVIGSKGDKYSAGGVVQPPNYVPFFNRVSGTGGLMFRAW